MKTSLLSIANNLGNSQNSPQAEKPEASVRLSKRSISRRSFLGKSFALGVGTVGAGFFISTRTARASGDLTPGDAALLRFPAALEWIEADFWLQYNELGGIPDVELPSGTGNTKYKAALSELDEDMDQYIHDNTEDEFTHIIFLDEYLISQGAEPVNLFPFATLQGSTATGVNTNLIGRRLTNLTQLTLDTSWWTRYRDPNNNPDLDPNHVFPQAVPSLNVGQHTAIPRDDSDLSNPDFVQAMANTAGFHFPTIEQGGSSLYPSLALRATSKEVLRILISIGPTETMHFQTWQDKAGNAPPLNNVMDPKTGVPVTFPDLSDGGELFQKNLIMPEPCPFLNASFFPCSVIRPTRTEGVAMGALKFLTDMGLFIGQSQAFFAFMTQLAQEADAAQPEN